MEMKPHPIAQKQPRLWIAQMTSSSSTRAPTATHTISSATMEAPPVPHTTSSSAIKPVLILT